MAKQIFLYKLAKDLAEQLEDDEEEMEQEFDDNEQFVTLDNEDEEDGRAVLQEYNEKLDVFTMKQSNEWQKLVQSQKHCVLSNLQERKFEDTRVLSRLMNMSLDKVNQQNIIKTQEELNVIQDKLQEICHGQLFTFFRVRDELAEALDVLHDHIFMVASHHLNHEQLVAITDRSDCYVQFDLRNY